MSIFHATGSLARLKPAHLFAAGLVAALATVTACSSSSTAADSSTSAATSATTSAAASAAAFRARSTLRFTCATYACVSGNGVHTATTMNEAAEKVVELAR